MKKKLLLILSALTILISLILLTTGIAGANSSQTWFLDGNEHPSETGNYVMIREGNGSPSGEVTIGTGSSNVEQWLSDETAVPASGVTFPAGTWTIYLHLEDITETPNGQVRIGSYSSGGAFVDFPGNVNIVVDFEGDLVTITKTTYNAQTVPQDGYLALRINNNLDIAQTVLCDGISRVESPDTSPDFPLPEMATGILLFVGMGGLGTFIIIRRKKYGINQG